MNRRQSVLLILCIVLLVVAGCTQTTPTPEMVLVEPATETAVPAPETPVPPTAEPAVGPTEAQPAPEAAQPTTTVVEGEELLAPEMPPEEPIPAGKVVDLAWGWAQGLAADQWFELQVKPDRPETEFEVFDWLLAPKVRITSADLLPGVYVWRVVVVEGRDEARGNEISALSVERKFILSRPSVSGRTVPTREVTTTPQPTATARIIYVTVVPSLTPVPPTPTGTLDPYVQPTATLTLEAPTATMTPGGYPQPTTTALTTGTPAPRYTDTPVPQPTATTDGYPQPTAGGPTAVPTEVPTVGPTAVPTAYPAPAD